MRVAHSFDELAVDGPVLLTIGAFDGVHRGHRFLLEQAARRAAEHGYRLLIVTFDPVPAVVLRPGLRRYQLTTAAQKLRHLRALGPLHILLLPFTIELSRWSADDFMAALEERVAVREIWLGEDFQFGRDRAGGLSMLVERGRIMGFSLHVVARRMEDEAGISSSRVRAALAAGDVAGAMPLLGYPFAVDLQVCRARAHSRAKSIATLRVPEYLALPATGGYATLLSGARGASESAVAFINDDAEAPLVVLPYRRRRSLEFIAPLPSSTAESDHERALVEAARIISTWERPHFPASGRL